MTYPDNFEAKVGFDEIRRMLLEGCQSPLGRELAGEVCFSDNAELINHQLSCVTEFRRLMAEPDGMPSMPEADLRAALKRIRPIGSHLDEEELYALGMMLQVAQTVKQLTSAMDEETYLFPTLHEMSSDVMDFPSLTREITRIFDRPGHIADKATPELARIRTELTRYEGSVSRILNNILRRAQQEGFVERDVTPTLRDGRLVIPVSPAMRRKIGGIVHDESATGKTLFVEPAEAVEANNRIRELEAEEKQEILRILIHATNQVRPSIEELMELCRFLGKIDLLRSKSLLAIKLKATEPRVIPPPFIDWTMAYHPLLRLRQETQGIKTEPLDIALSIENRILIISGPNAGGKSVCLKTVGLLQYMVQCGLSIPVGENSGIGIFGRIMIDIGDAQSISDDLSTYSAHLTNMKNMLKLANLSSLVLIDEFGTGTEPQMGGAIAEAVLTRFWKQKTFAVITTHYRNLKHFADNHEGVVNGAMLYDRHQMQALYRLAIGQPGSSFAIEIARKTGLPDDVIQQASDIVGNDYVQTDKYLQDIVRDKRYWENKRESIHQREKDMDRTIEHYEKTISELEQERKAILRRAKEQAQQLLDETNRRIENAIREIKEAQAEKEETRRIREDIGLLREEVETIDTKANDELIEKKIKQIQARQERHKKWKEDKDKKKEERKAQAAELAAIAKQNAAPTASVPSFKPGDTVRAKGLTTVGRIESIKGSNAVVVFGDAKMRMKVDALEACEAPKKTAADERSIINVTRSTRATIDERRSLFHQDIDLRGLRGDEALNEVMHFIDDAILIGMNRVRILHGKGNGILRQLIRQYLRTVPQVKNCADEHVQFGGAGITVVELY